MTSEPSRAEDLTQDTFVRAWQKLETFRGKIEFSTWLYRLTTNVTRMHLRKGRSRPRFADVEVPETHSDGRPPETPDVQIERAERVRALYRLLDGLSDKKREVLVLHDLEGVAAKEIAVTLEIPVLTVRTRLFYARKDLYAALAAEPISSARMGAPRAFACSRLSMTKTAAPSDETNPSRLASNGRLALAGSSLVESTFMTAKEARPSSHMPASEPPVSITSTLPKRISDSASPIACVAAAHAVVMVLLGPFAWKRMLT